MALFSVVIEAGLLRLQGFIFSLLWQLGNFSATLAKWEEELRIVWLSFTAVALCEESAKYLALFMLWFLLAPIHIAHDSSICAHAQKDCGYLKNTALQLETKRKNKQFLLLIGLNLALGFSAAENLWYMLRYESESIYWRLASTTLVHFCLAVLLSLQFWNFGNFWQKQKNPTLRFTGVLIGPVFWHGAYNSALAINPGGKTNWTVLTVFFALLLYSSARLAVSFLRPGPP